MPTLRRGDGEMKFWKDKKFRPRVTVLKMKGEKPSVIEVSGRRYVYSPNDVNSGKGTNKRRGK